MIRLIARYHDFARKDRAYNEYLCFRQWIDRDYK